MKITINKTVRYTHLKKEFVVHTLKKKKKKKKILLSVHLGTAYLDETENILLKV